MSRPQGWSSFRNSRSHHVGAGLHPAKNVPFPPLAEMLTAAPSEQGGGKGVGNHDTLGGTNRERENENAGTATGPRTPAPIAAVAPTAS